MKYAYPQKYLYINNKRSSHGLINITFVRYYDRDIFFRRQKKMRRHFSVSSLYRFCAVILRSCAAICHIGRKRLRKADPRCRRCRGRVRVTAVQPEHLRRGMPMRESPERELQVRLP